MKQITVDITEILSRGITVEAETNEDAIELVKTGHKAETYVLDSSDFVDVDFSIAEDTPSIQVVTLDKGIDPRCTVLIKEGNEAKTKDGRLLQVSQAAYIDGYITAAGEVSRFITKLWQYDKAVASTVHNALESLRKQQDESYNKMCARLNDTAAWDET